MMPNGTSLTVSAHNEKPVTISCNEKSTNTKNLSVESQPTQVTPTNPSTTAQDKKTSQLYTVSITRKKAAKSVVIVATKYDFSDALAGSVLAGQSGGEVLRTGNTKEDARKIVSYVKKKYDFKDQIYIIGLGKAVYRELDQLLQNEGFTNIICIGGEDKYETAKEIAENVKVSKTAKVILINGNHEPENAKEIQKICMKLDYPILFVKTKSLTEDTIEVLKNIKPEQIYLVGDKKQIDLKMVEEIQKLINIKDKNIIRVSQSSQIK